MLFNYSLYIHQFPITSNFPLQLIISLNLAFISLYALFKDNIILNSSEEEKSIIAMTITLYALIYEFTKTVLNFENCTYDYLAIFIFIYILILPLLHSKHSQFFDKIKKFGYGFATIYVYLTLTGSEKFKLIHSIIGGRSIAFNNSGNNEAIAIITSNCIYCMVLAQGLISLVTILAPNEDGAAALIGYIAVGIFSVLILLIALISQLREVKRRTINEYSAAEGNSIEEGRSPPSQAGNTGSNNYSTFSS